MKDSKNALDWINHAFEEIRSAEHLYNHLYPQPLEVICFLSQQTAEKSLKAFLASRNMPIQKTHDLTAILGECVEIDPDFSAFYAACECMAPMAVAVRYPDHYEVTQPDMETAFNGAAQIYEFVCDKLGLEQVRKLVEVPGIEEDEEPDVGMNMT